MTGWSPVNGPRRAVGSASCRREPPRDDGSPLLVDSRTVDAVSESWLDRGSLVDRAAASAALLGGGDHVRSRRGRVPRSREWEVVETEIARTRASPSCRRALMLAPSAQRHRPRPGCRRHLERRALHALRRAARRRALRCADHSRRVDLDGSDGRRVRDGRRRPDARAGDRGPAARAASASSAPSATTSTPASATVPRAFRGSPTRRCATRPATRTTCAWRPSAASSAAGSTRSTCCCSTTPTASATPARRSGTGWRRCAKPA